MLTGRSTTGIIHLCNQTMIDWYSKSQATVDTAAFKLELTAAQIAVDQIIDLRTTFDILGSQFTIKATCLEIVKLR
jgi:hypothetical protein